MAALTLSNLPEHLFARLKQRADEHGRSIEAEAVECLDLATRDPSRDSVERTLADLQRFRSTLDPKLKMDEKGLAAAKREGRP